MLRLPNLLRSRLIPRLATRSGPPGWDRPDPPASAHIPYDHELSDEEIVFFFPDGSMPEYVLTQPEVYEGDTLLEATPMFLKGWGLLGAFAVLIGFTAWVTNPFTSYTVPNHFQHSVFLKNKEMAEQKSWVKWANENPLGLTVSSENFPPFKNETGENVLGIIGENYDKNQKVLKQVRAYLTGIKAKATEIVNKRLTQPHIDHSVSHSQHHGEHHGEHASQVSHTEPAENAHHEHHEQAKKQH